MPLPRKQQQRELTTDASTLPLASAADLTRIALFRDIPRELLGLLQGKARRAAADPSETILELLPTEQFFHYFFFIAGGQVKLVGYDEEARTKPLNFLRKGEFFVDKSLRWGRQVATKVVAVSAVDLLVVGRRELSSLAQRHPPLNKKLADLTERIDLRNRTYAEEKYSRSVLEFLIDRELTQASRVKITQMDKCIECNTCYTSCEERHGFQRLERGYARFGVLDFAKSCITCFYPACIPACPVDSVVFNSATGEVEILDNCIGCAACERACVYGAIQMHRVEPEDPRFARFLGPDRKRVRPKYIADKCNHCHGYEDMVCITNCPTGAIIELTAAELMDRPRIFGAADEGWHELPSLTRPGRGAKRLRYLYVLLFLAVTFSLLWEAAALRRFPGLSALLGLQRSGFIPAGAKLNFERGSDFCLFLGNFGFTLILLGLLYPLRKAFPRWFKYLGKKPLWLDFHNFCGLTATVLILFHTGFKLPAPSLSPLQLSTLGFWALAGVALSGIFGRFLYLLIPRGVAGTELKMRDIEEEDAGLTKKLDALFPNSGPARALVSRFVETLTADASRHPGLWTLTRAVVRSRWLLLKLRFRLPDDLRINRRQIGIFLELLHEKIRLQRNVAFLSVSSRMFARWKHVHRALVYAMAAIAIGHIAFNVLFFAGR